MGRIKFRYYWKNQMHYIEFYKDNLAIKFEEFESRAKTTRLMQYTGLKDKNGTEIYEGDIVTLNWCKESIGKISWGAGFWKVAWNKEGECNNRRLFVLTGLRIEDTSPFEYSRSSVIVLGNIWENPKRGGEKKDD